MPSPAPSPRRSPKRSPKRKALHERSQSQANEISLRLVKDDSQPKEADVFVTSPFPTKAAHVLRPVSTVLGQGSVFDEDYGVSGGGLPGPLLEHVNKNKGKGRALSNASSSRPQSADARTLSLKRSVAALREHFERQASSSSAPLSPELSPQAPRGRHAGLDTFFMTPSDEVLIVPATSFTADPEPNLLRKYKSDETLPPILDSPRVSHETSHSHHSRSSTPELSSGQDSSSPNVIRLGGRSSPALESDDLPSSPQATFDEEPSSPIIEHLKRSSSPFPRLVDVSRSSSPNVVQLGSSSSPNVVHVGVSSPSGPYFGPQTSHSNDSSGSEGTVIKQLEAREQPSYSTFPTSATRYSSSPPDRPLNTYPSASSFDFGSDPETASQQSGGIDRSFDDLHAILESTPAPESSPPPSIQYPVVHAPAASTWAELRVPKRPPRAMPNRNSGHWDPHLSTIPSEWSGEDRRQSNLPSTTAEENEADDEPIELPPPPFLRGRDVSYATNSTIRVVSEYDRSEASDNVSDLRTMSLRGKASGFLSIVSSNAGSRANSLQSSIHRSSSVGSLRSTLPTWARRYYSLGGSSLAVGMYPSRDSWPSSDLRQSGSSRPPTSSVSAVTEHFPLGIFRPRSRPRNLRTQSGYGGGPGPLTSHPTPTTGDPPEMSEMRHGGKRLKRVRPKSLPLDPSDPRSHWAGAEQAALESELGELESQLRQSRIANEWSPHLFHDIRAEKSGNARRHRWRAPSLRSIGGSGHGIFGRRNLQVWGFYLGFVLPVTWFVAAILPLPKESGISFADDEDGPAESRLQSRGPQMMLNRRSTMRMSREDLESHVRLEQKQAVVDEIRYENARWWRNMNRFMSVVGVIIIILVVVLAIVGTRSGGFS